MTRALVAIHNTTYGGVYYSNNIDFSDLATQPTWARLATTGLDNLLVKVAQYDPSAPYDDIYLQLDNNDLYHWNGASWDKIMDKATAEGLCGYAGGEGTVGYIAIDPSAPGTIYYPIQKITVNAKLLKSTNYGSTWSVINVITAIVSGVPQVQANGLNIIYNYTGVIDSNWQFSTNGGSSWTQYAGSNAVPFRIDNFTPTNAYCTVSALDNNLARVTVGGQTTLQNGSTLASINRDRMWIDPTTANHHRILRLISSNVQLFATVDAWANLIDASPDVLYTGIMLFGALAAARENNNYIMVGYQSTSGDVGQHRVYGLVGETAASWSGISGANYTTAPYTGAIPALSGVYVAVDGIWVGEEPADKGIFVYADEQGDITDIPDYDGLGAPLFGDRASWRNRNIDGFRDYHAEDARRDALEMHTPLPTGNDGYGIKEVGGYWVNTDEALVTAGDLHDPVTLDSDAALLLDLTGQEIGLDTQAANRVFAGPASGAANEPTFRALVAGDLPAIALNDLSDVDTTGTSTGDIIYNDAGTYKDYPLGVGSTFVVDSGKLKIGDSAGGNYIEIDLTLGTLRLIGDATSWDDLRVAASVVKPGVTAPNYKSFGPSGSLQALMFEAGHHDEVHFEVQMPHSWKEGSNIYPHVHWTPTTADAGNVVWQLEYSWANINGTFGAPGNMATAATAAGGTAWVHKMTALVESGNAYISGAGKTISSMLVCRLHRNSNSGSDTLNKDVAFLEIDFHYEVDSFGSDTESVKDYVPPVPGSNAPILEIQVFDDLYNVTGPLQDDGSDRLENEVMS